MGTISIGTPVRTSVAPGFTLYNFRVLRPGTPSRHATVPGMILLNSDPAVVLESEVDLELLKYPDFDTVLSELLGSFDISFTEQKNDAGSGMFSLSLSDDDAALIQPGGDYFVRFRRFTQACMIMACEVFHRTARDSENKDAKEIVAWSGPGHAIILDDAVMYPARGLNHQPREVDRPFDWTSPAFSATGWYPPIVIAEWYIFVAASEFIDPDHIAGGAVTFLQHAIASHTPILARPFSSITFALEGDDYFRQTVTIAISFWYTLRYWNDDYGEIYIDGQKTLETTDWTSQSDALVYLTAGDHTFAYHLHNYAGPIAPFTLINPEGVAWSLFLAGGIFESYDPVAVSDTSAVMMALAATPPGMPIGEILIISLEEAQARGCFPGLTWTFTRTHDSAGNEWQIVNEISTKVGTSYKAFFDEIAATWMDYRFQPGGLVMDAWVKDTMGQNLGVEWVNSDTILALEQEGGG